MLIPLFQKMGFKDVIEYHGPAEKGKDIIFYETDKFDSKIYTGVVVGAPGAGKTTLLKHMALKACKENRAFLDEIWRRSYLLRQIAMGTYDFLHLSFQEYFMALELRKQEDGIGTIIQHISEPWWEDPILLYAGISEDADTLIRRIQKEVPENRYYFPLMLTGKCAADSEFTDAGLKEWGSLECRGCPGDHWEYRFHASTAGVSYKGQRLGRPIRLCKRSLKNRGQIRRRTTEKSIEQ